MRGPRRALTHAARPAAVILAVALLAGAAPARARQASGPTAASPSFDELYKRGRQLNADISTLTARFTETTTSSLLEQPIVERGTLFVERATPRVAMRYADTDRVLLIDGDRMTTLWPSRQIEQSRNIRDARRRLQGYFDDASASELRRVFDILLRETSERAGTHEVQMLPKRRQISETLKELELWVDDTTALMRAMRLTFANGDTKLMEFEDVTPNAPIDAGVFSAGE